MEFLAQKANNSILMQNNRSPITKHLAKNARMSFSSQKLQTFPWDFPAPLFAFAFPLQNAILKNALKTN